MVFCVIPLDLEAVRLEDMLWSCTPQLRWYRPKGGNDNEIVLQQLWERVTGERAWRTVQTCLED